MAQQMIIDQPPEAVDKIYAQSLFAIAESEGGRDLLEQLAAEMAVLEESRSQDPQINEFFRSRIIPAAAKEAALRRGLDGRIHPLLLKFMLLAARKERLDRVIRMFNAFEHMLQEKFGRVEVDVYTRYPMPQSQVDALRDRLQQTLQREPIMHVYVDDKMIGGLRLQVGDKLIDATVDTRLRRMKDLLIEDGGNVVRDRIRGMLDE